MELTDCTSSRDGFGCYTSESKLTAVEVTVSWCMAAGFAYAHGGKATLSRCTAVQSGVHGL